MIGQLLVGFFVRLREGVCEVTLPQWRNILRIAAVAYGMILAVLLYVHALQLLTCLYMIAPIVLLALPLLFKISFDLHKQSRHALFIGMMNVEVRRRGFFWEKAAYVFLWCMACLVWLAVLLFVLSGAVKTLLLALGVLGVLLLTKSVLIDINRDTYYAKQCVDYAGIHTLFEGESSLLRLLISQRVMFMVVMLGVGGFSFMAAFDVLPVHAVLVIVASLLAVYCFFLLFYFHPRELKMVLPMLNRHAPSSQLPIFCQALFDYCFLGKSDQKTIESAVEMTSLSASLSPKETVRRSNVTVLTSTPSGGDHGVSLQLEAHV